MSWTARHTYTHAHTAIEQLGNLNDLAICFFSFTFLPLLLLLCVGCNSFVYRFRLDPFSLDQLRSGTRNDSWNQPKNEDQSLSAKFEEFFYSLRYFSRFPCLHSHFFCKRWAIKNGNHLKFLFRFVVWIFCYSLIQHASYLHLLGKTRTHPLTKTPKAENSRLFVSVDEWMDGMDRSVMKMKRLVTMRARTRDRLLRSKPQRGVFKRSLQTEVVCGVGSPRKLQTRGSAGASRRWLLARIRSGSSRGLRLSLRGVFLFFWGILMVCHASVQLLIA